MENELIKILAIDDNNDNLITIKALILEAFPDVKVLTALSGEKGIELALKEIPNVILLDVIMPDMDGFEVCEKLKLNAAIMDIPVVFVTALKTDKQSRIKALEVGAEGFLSKPIDESELVAQIRAMLKVRMANVVRRDENERLQTLVTQRTNDLKHTHTATLNLLEDLKNENEARRQTEQALVASEALYRSVINASPDNITVTDLSGNVRMVSPKGLDLIGYATEKALHGKSISEFLIPEHRDRATKNIMSMFQGVFNGPEEYTLIKADGSTVDTEINAEFIRGVNGEPTGLVFAIRDITDRKQAEDTIREGERQYRLITEKISDVVWIMDLTGRSLFVSQSVENFTGYTVEEYLAQSIDERFTPESVKMAFQTLNSEVYKYTHGEKLPPDYKKILVADYLCKDGSIKTGELLITPYFDDNNKLVGVHGVTRDVTERKKAENSLRESEEKYRLLVENSPSGIAIYQDGKFVYVNKTGLKIFGTQNADDLLGKPVLSIVHPDSMPAVIKRVSRVSHGGEVPPLEEKLIRFDGTVFDAEVAALGTIFNGRPAGQVIVSDITARKVAEESLRESEEKYRFLAENTSDVIWHMDIHFRFDYLSPAIEKVQGYKPQELIGKELFGLMNAEGISHIQEMGANIKTDQEKGKLPREMQFEYETICKDGSWKWVEVSVTVHFDNKMNPIGFYGVTRDISERKKNEIILRESEEKFRDMANLLPQVVFELNSKGEITYINHRSTSVFGYAEGELLGLNSLVVHIPEEHERVVKNINLKCLGETIEDREYTMKRKDGSLFPALVYTDSVTKNNEVVGLRGIVVDITDQKKAEEEIRESEEKFRDMANLLPQVVFEMKLTGEITYVNQQAKTVFGYEIDELIGSNSLMAHVPEERERVQRDLIQMINGVENLDRNFNLLRKDGTVFPALIYINVIVKDNVAVGLRGVVVDITDQKVAEAKIRESQSKYYELYTLMRLMSDTMPDMLWAKDLAGNYTFANKAMCDRLLHAVDTNEPVGRPDVFFAKRERDLHSDNPQWHTFGEICHDTDTVTIQEMRQMQFDEFGMVQGQYLYLDVHKAPLLNENNELIGVVGTARDITERKLAEEKLSFVTRLYALLSHVNQAIVQIKNTDELLETICELVIQYGQFRMCWIGAYDDTENVLNPIKSAGFVDGYLDSLIIKPGDKKYGKGPTGVSLSDRKSMYCNDIEADPIMLPWKEEALKRGYRSLFASPLYRKNKIFGNLTLYATQTNFFNEEEQNLLSKISENVSYAIDAIDSETERQQSEQALIESEVKFRELMDNSPEGITIYVDGKVAYINKEALRLMRAKDKSEMMGKTIVDFIHPDNQALVLERMKMVAMAPINAILPSVEEKYIRLDGTEVYVEIKVMPIIFDGNHAIQLSGHDITDRKEAEFALEQSRSELKTIYDHAPVMMCVVDKERKIQFANEAFTSLTGIPEEIMRGGPVGGVIGCINSFDAPKGCGYGPNCKNCGLRVAIEDTFKSGTEYQNVEYHSNLMVGLEQREVYLLGSTSLIQTSKQKQVLLCLHDITDRKLAEEALHKSEMLLRTFIDNTPFEIWARDIDSVGILENKKLTDHFGSIVGHTPQTDPRIDKDTKLLWERNNARVFAGNVIDEEYEFEVHGEIRIFQQIVFPIKLNNKIIGIAGFNIDITDRKIAEEKIHENSIKLDMAMQVANMAWWEMNLKTGNVTFGKRKTDMIGFLAENFTHYNDFMELVHPDDFEGSMQAMRDHIYGTADKYEKEYRIKTVEGDYKWFYDIGSISKRDLNGEPLIVSGLVLDITLRKQTEVSLRESQEQLKKFAAHLQNVREEERVLLAREIHDQLGQILVAVKIDMGMLKQNVLKNIGNLQSGELKEKFDALSALIDNTIKTARKIMTDLRPEVLDMLGFIETVNQHLKGFQERHKTTCKLETHISKLEMSSQQSVALFRIIQEALNNIAKHAKATEVTVIISQLNDKLMLEIKDNGVGFDLSNKKNMDSYGLIGMKERVFLIDGELKILSEKGEGTTIQVIIPCGDKIITE